MSAEMPNPEKPASQEQAQVALTEIERILAAIPPKAVFGKVDGRYVHALGRQRATLHGGVNLSLWKPGIEVPYDPTSVQLASAHYVNQDTTASLFSIEEHETDGLRLKATLIGPREEEHRLINEIFSGVNSHDDLVRVAAEKPEELMMLFLRNQIARHDEIGWC
jgi:hypothetical protein